MAALDTFLNRRTIQFLAIYQAGNIHGAAESLGISQPALTISLKQLEESLGTPLFKRSVKGMAPTSAGELYYRFACTLRQGARLAAEAIDAQKTGDANKLRVGAGVAWTTTVLPPVLSDLYKKIPRLAIDVVTGVGDQLAALFVAGEIDVFLAGASMDDIDGPGVHREFLINLPMVAVADASSSLASKDAVTAADLLTVEWAGFYEDDSFVHLANHYMSLRGLPAPRIAMRTNSAAALTALVKATDLVTVIVSPLAAVARQSGLVQLPLSEPLWNVPVNLYCREIAADLTAVSTFITRVRQEIEMLSQPSYSHTYRPRTAYAK